MMSEITVKVHSKRWINSGEENIVKRIALAVVGTTEFIQEQETGYRWHIKGNDWHCSGLDTKVKRDGAFTYQEIKVSFRYGKDKLMESWNLVLNDIFS